MDEACAYGQYLENIGLKKGQAYFSKMKEHHGDSKEGKMKWKEGKGKNTSTSTHKCKYHKTSAMIATSMATLRKNIGIYI
jgi:hypothetical protein